MKKLFASLASLLLGIGIVVLPVMAPAMVQAKVVKKVTKKPVYRRLSVSAVPGKDERNFADSATRCLTPAMIKLNDQSVATMKADIAKLGAGHETAVNTYMQKMDILWSAMAEPYCGYGSRGMAAVKKSFIKSVDHVRADFLAAVK